MYVRIGYTMKNNTDAAWYHIDTAPNDGTFYLAVDKDGDMRVMNGPKGCAPGIWHKTGKKWHGSSISTFKATHWTALPNKPDAVHESCETTQYKDYEYCIAINCRHVRNLQAGNNHKCQRYCRAYRFHDYLNENGYMIVKDKG